MVAKQMNERLKREEQGIVRSCDLPDSDWSRVHKFTHKRLISAGDIVAHVRDDIVAHVRDDIVAHVTSWCT